MFSQATVSLQPISSLSPFIGRWFIKARVIDKSPIRTWNNTKTGQGQLFSMTLVDENADAIRATMFQAGVTKFNDLLQNGRVYIFSKGTVKTANKKFNQLPSDYELSFDDTAEITPAEDDDSIQRQKYNFNLIAGLPQKEKNSIVDICGILLEAGEMQQIVTRTQERLDKRVLTIADHSGVKVDLTVWGQQARDFSAATGSVIAAKACRLGDYGGVSLSLTQQGSVSVEPDNQFADSVRQWVRQNNGNLDVASLTDRTAGETRSMERRTFAVIATDGLGLNPDKPDYLTLRFTLVHVKADNMWYLACPDCNRKLLPQGDIPNVTYRCEKCDSNKIPQPRYILTCQAYDHTGSQQISAFQDVAKAILKVPAEQLKQQEEERPGTCQELAKSLCFRQYVARLRVKEEGQADDRRIKCVLQSCTPVNVTTECNVLLRHIKRYMAL